MDFFKYKSVVSMKASATGMYEQNKTQTACDLVCTKFWLSS